MDVQSLQSQLEEVIFWTCRKTIPAETLEIQAIICVTVPSSCHEHVVKIHQTFNKDSLAYSKCSLRNDGSNKLSEVNEVPGQNNVAMHCSDTTQDVGNNFQTQKAANIINNCRGKRLYTHRKKFYNASSNADPSNNARNPASELKQFIEQVNDNDSHSANTGYIKVEMELDGDEYGGSYPGNEHDEVLVGSKVLADEVSTNMAECVDGDNSIDMSQYTYSIRQKNKKSSKQKSVAREMENYSDDGSLQGSPSDLSSSMMAYNLTPVIAPDTCTSIQSMSPLNQPNLPIPNVAAMSKWNMRLPALANTSTTDEHSDDCSPSEDSSNVSATIQRLKCSHCGAMFSSARTRKRHEKTTCGTLKFTCEQCGKLYSRKDALRRHMIKVHQCESADDTDITGIVL